MNQILPNLPSGWVWTRVDRVADVSARIGWKALTAAEYVLEGYTFLATPNIKTETIDFDNVHYIPEWRYAESPELMLKVGDVLLVKDGSTLGITNIVRELPKPATVNGSIAIVRSISVEPRFLRYVLASDMIQGIIESLRAGMGVPHLFQADIKKMPIPLPPFRFQEAIADYLDAEIARIDALVEKKMAVACLVEQKLRMLARDLTFTDGQRLQLRRCIQQIKTGTTPPEDKLETLRDGLLPWYSPGDVEDWLELRGPSRTLDVRAVSERWVPPFRAQSTLVVGIGATAGRVAHLDVLASGNQQMTCVTAGSRLLPRFLSWQLHSRTDELRATAPFTTLPIINNEFLKSLELAVPDLDSQRVVVEALDLAVGRARALTAAIGRQVELLQERRQALITAAVTGQLDIPAVAA